MISIDAGKCTTCGRCVEECPSFILKIEDKIPVMTYEKGCIQCGHCVAICPYSAFDHAMAPLVNQSPLPQHPVFGPIEAERFLRSRRSVRNFKKNPVQRVLLSQLVNIARFAPSAGNSQGISYLIVDNPATLELVSEATTNWITSDSSGSRRMRYYKVFVEKYAKEGIDVILRNAPVLVVALAPRQLETGFSNARFSLAYTELYATTLGLASCWAGFFELCGQALYHPLYDQLQIPEDKIICGGLMVGYPKYEYKRLVDRNPLDVKFI